MGRRRPLGDRYMDAATFRVAYADAIALLVARRGGRATQVEIAKSIGLARSTVYRYRVEVLGQPANFSVRTRTGPHLASTS